MFGTKHLIKNLIVTVLLVIACSSTAIQAAGASPDKANKKLCLSDLTLEEKVGQLFIVDLARLDDLQTVTELKPSITQKLEKYKLGGIILFAQNLVNKTQILNLISDIRKTERTPMFICIDEEGGRVSRLQHTKSLHLEMSPSAEKIGKRDDKSYAYKVGLTLAEQVKKFGFNVDFAPVVDINTNPNNTVIGARSFGSTPLIVSEMSTEIIRALQDNNVMAAAKHFPGHGDTTIDTHHALAFINHDLTRLRNEEFIPFQNAIDNGVMSIMLAHIVVPKVTGSDIPATMSPIIVEDILRKEMGFNGLIITDALMMKAITENYSTAEVCTKAIEAGVDILLMPDNIEEGYQAVLNKAKSNPEFLKKVNQAVTRILNAKNQLGLTN